MSERERRRRQGEDRLAQLASTSGPEPRPTTGADGPRYERSELERQLFSVNFTPTGWRLPTPRASETDRQTPKKNPL